MMGLDSLGLGSAGSMSKTIMSIIGIGISAIILLTFAPKISGDVSGIALLGATPVTANSTAKQWTGCLLKEAIRTQTKRGGQLGQAKLR